MEWLDDQILHHPRPIPPKWRCFLEESGLPTRSCRSTRARASSTVRNSSPSIPMVRRRRSSDGDVTVFDSNAILLYLAEKSGKFPSRRHSGGARFAAVLADVRGEWHRPLFGPGRPFQACRARPASTTPSIVISSRLIATGHSRRPGSQTSLYAGRDLYDRRYGVWGWARAVPYIFCAEAWPNCRM